MDSAWSSKTDPVPLGGLAVAVAAGTSHSLVLLANGTVRAFGLGESGQLGYGSTSKVGDKASTLPSDQGPVPLGGTAAAVAAGDAFSLVLLTNGSILAFGDGARGNLGYGSIDDVGYDEATLPSDKGPVPLGGTAVALSAGGSHSLVVLDDGTVRSFGIALSGRNLFPHGQLHGHAFTYGIAIGHSHFNSHVFTYGLAIGHFVFHANAILHGHGHNNATPSPSHTASPSASPSPSGGASGSIGLNGAGSGGAADDAAMPFIVIGAVAGGALLVGGAAWAMKQTTLGQLAARSATAGASDSAGAGAVQQDGGVSGEATAVGGVGGLSSLGAELPASGGSRV
ncbi:hypothetical protein FNF31_05402 [Cafeteria roenbergensis]|uniref:Uncharacterized protein n=1 Tax=Cafeteria roenbergensis TaxID=33653 RepID=A0A5A8D3B5_CAFRO|nr:hypothetical protein FNF31_05402 [Cafeteria roenbergensis]